MKDIEKQTPDIQARVKAIEAYPVTSDEKLSEMLKELLSIARQEDNLVVQGFCYAYLARCYYGQDDIHHSNECLKAGLPLQQQMDDLESLAISYNMLGIDALNHGNYPIALDYFMNSIHCAEKDTLYHGAVLANIGLIYYEIGVIEKAIEYVHRAHDIYEACGGNENDMIALSQEAIYYSTLGQTEKARELLSALGQRLSEYSQEENFYIDPVFYSSKIFYYDAIHDTKERDRALDEFINSLKTEPSILDLSDDINGIAALLMDAQSISRVPELLEFIREPVENSGINHLKLKLLETEIRYYQLLGDERKCKELQTEFFDVSMAKKIDDQEMYRLNVDLRNSLEKLQEKQIAIERENRRLLHAASTDGLTNIPNRTLLNQKAEEWFDRARQNHQKIAFEMLDIDYFKQYNDTYGHHMGDVVLQKIAQVLESMVDERTFVARYGGDEFMIIYLGMEDEEVLRKAEEMQRKVQILKIPHKKSQISTIVTISQGIRNSAVTSANRLWDFTSAADYALYHVKEHKRGGIHLVHRVHRDVEGNLLLVEDFSGELVTYDENSDPS